MEGPHVLRDLARRVRLGRVAARVAAGDKRREAGDIFEGVESREVLGAAARSGRNRRASRPSNQAVAGADLGHRAIHLAARDLHQRILAVVLERDVLNAVDAEQRELADVLLELRDGPGVPGVRGRTIPELVAADRVRRRAGDVERRVELERALGPSDLSQEMPDTVERAPGVRAGNQIARSSARRRNPRASTAGRGRFGPGPSRTRR